MRNTKKGFTLVELLTVIAILAVLATVSVVGYISFINRANDSIAQQELTQIRDYYIAGQFLVPPTVIDDELMDELGLEGTLEEGTVDGDKCYRYTIKTGAAYWLFDKNEVVVGLTGWTASTPANPPAGGGEEGGEEGGETGGEEGGAAACEHGEVRTPATCVASAVCNLCGESFGEPNPDAHNMVADPESAVAPTCTTYGREAGTKCSRCTHKVDGAVIPASHNHATTWSFDNEQHWHECTCGDKKDVANHDWQDGFCTICDKEVTWTLVTDASQLSAGNKVVIVANGYDYALSTTQNKNNRGQVQITKNDDGTITINENVQVILLLDADGDSGNFFAFYVEGSNFAEEGSADRKFLNAGGSSGNNTLKTVISHTATSTWSITINDGVADIVAQGTNDNKIMRYNSTSSLFACYGSGQKALAIYVSSEKVPTNELPEITPVVPEEPETPVDPEPETPVCTSEHCEECGLCLGGNNCTVCSNEQKCEGHESQTLTATLSFADKAQRTEYSTSVQVWEQNGIKLTNNKGSSTSNVADYAKPARFYKSSTVTVEHVDMVKIEFTCNTAAYATALKDSINNATVSVSDKVVTVTFDSPVDSFTIEELSGGQVRMDSLTVTYIAE